MTTAPPLPLPFIESSVCDVAAEQLGVVRAKVHPGLRLVQDLHCDSLDFVELLMRVEETFDVSLDDSTDAAYKSVFTRDPFRLCDLAELVYLRQGAPRTCRAGRWRVTPAAPVAPVAHAVPFTQLGGRIHPHAADTGPLYEPFGHTAQGFPLHRRRTDGMPCVLVPAADVVLGDDADDASPDECPAHSAWIDAFLIDQEPVSTTAYCRFLNSIGDVDAALLETWFVPAPGDRRQRHLLLQRNEDGWSPLGGAERMPMMLVSWYGANAYSLWANRRDWRAHRDDERAHIGGAAGARGDTFLPTEAQWEYAARGPRPRRYPWGDATPTPEHMRFARHAPGATYRAEDLPLADVNADLGVSPFGLRHMAGNVWQWCRDWYSPTFYTTPAACAPDPANDHATRVRSERGGSWIGPATLCRCSYRRGRTPSAKGRCLGFRCVGDPREAVR